MSEYATKGATMVCDKGIAPSKLQVTSNTLLSVQGNMVATVSDKIPNTNIMPFGVCAVTRKPCNPAPIMWTGFLASVQIPGGNPLLKTSKLPCALGGCIKFLDSGQLKPNKVRLNPTSPQIEALRRAALEAVPFCEECEKKEKKKDPAIIRIYWVDEHEEIHSIDELLPKQEVTLCIDVEEGGIGQTIDLVLETDTENKFKGGKLKLEYKGLVVEDDNTAYIDNFSIEYEEKED